MFTGSSYAQETVLLAEMRKEVTALRSERDQLRTALDAALSEVQSLKEVTSASKIIPTGPLKVFHLV